jgi:hypothetical protein
MFILFLKLTDEPIFSENAEAALQLYEKEIKNNVSLTQHFFATKSNTSILTGFKYIYSRKFVDLLKALPYSRRARGCSKVG